MADITVKKGLLDPNGEIVNGSYISNLSPDKIIYTGSVESEIEQLKKWANKMRIPFEQKKFNKDKFDTIPEVKSFKAEVSKTDISKMDTTEPTVEELFPE